MQLSDVPREEKNPANSPNIYIYIYIYIYIIKMQYGKTSYERQDQT
jgi:hypothetical protein